MYIQIIQYLYCSRSQSLRLSTLKLFSAKYVGRISESFQNIKYTYPSLVAQPLVDLSYDQST